MSPPFLVQDLFSVAETGYIPERNLFHQCDILLIVTCTSWRLWRHRGVEQVWLCVYCVRTKWKGMVSLMLQLSQRKLSRCQRNRTDTKASLHAVAQRFLPPTAWTEILAFQVSIGTQMLPLYFVPEIKPITHGIINELILISTLNNWSKSRLAFTILWHNIYFRKIHTHYWYDLWSDSSYFYFILWNLWLKADLFTSQHVQSQFLF